MNYITDEVRSIIGAETDFVEATHAVEASEVRRFHQATMDPAPRYWDRAVAAKSRYGAVVAPPAFPVHAFRTPPDAPDPLIGIDEPDRDGVSRAFRGLPEVKVPLPRLLNGGYQYEFFRYARVGERVRRKARYRDIYQRDGKNGPMVFIEIEETYVNGNGDLLLRSISTLILR